MIILVKLLLRLSILPKLNPLLILNSVLKLTSSSLLLIMNPLLQMECWYK